MINFTGYFFLFVLIGCGMIPPRTLLSKVREAKHHKINDKPISSEAEAKTYMQNQLNYLKLLYQQSRDPYYGEPKWTEYCLKNTKIGEIKINKHYFISVSDLYMNADGEFGYCPGNRVAERGYFILLYCMNKKNVISDIRLQYDPNLDLKKLDLCP